MNPDTIVDFWLGHEIGDMAKAYKETQVESLRKMYLEREHLLSISAPKGEDEKTKAEVKEVKDDLYKLHLENKQMKQQIKSLNAQISDMYKFVHENLDPVLDTFTAFIETPEGMAALDKIPGVKASRKRKIAEIRDRENKD